MTEQPTDDLDKYCFYCGSDEPFTVNGIFAELREVDAIYCCEEQRDDVATFLASLTVEEWRELWRGYFKKWDADAGGILKAQGLEVRNLLRDGCVLDYKLTIRPLDQPYDQTKAKEWLRRYHRHNPELPGWIFGLACYNGRQVVAIAWVGRPRARGYNHRKVIEVNRICVRDDVQDGLQKDAYSMLYAAAAQEAERRGYHKIITYTMNGVEDGTSIKAAGWKYELTTEEGRSWDCQSRPREQKSPTCARDRWSKALDPLRHRENRRRERIKAAATLFILTSLKFDAQADKGETPAAIPPPPQQPHQPALFF
jgi:hypothetical protein